MSGLPELINNEPVIIPAIPEKIFDRFWQRLLTVSAPTPAEPCRAYCEFRPYRVVNGQGEVKSPEVDGDIRAVEVVDLFALENPNIEPLLTLETRQALGQAMYMTLQALKLVARDKGIFGMSDVVLSSELSESSSSSSESSNDL